MGTSGYNLVGSQAKISSDYDTEKRRKVKKMGFFKRWLLKQVQKGHEIEREGDMPVPLAISKASTNIDQPERALQFTVYTANGGRVVETRRYDRQKDRHNQNLYIITNDQDFGREIDKIITMEALR